MSLKVALIFYSLKLYLSVIMINPQVYKRSFLLVYVFVIYLYVWYMYLLYLVVFLRNQHCVGSEGKDLEGYG